MTQIDIYDLLTPDDLTACVITVIVQNTTMIYAPPCMKSLMIWIASGKGENKEGDYEAN